jgi:hypothetical protein
VCALKNATFAHISIASCWAPDLDNAPTLGLYPNLEGGNFCEIASVFVDCRLFRDLCFSTPRAHHSISPHKKKKKKKKKTTNINEIAFDQGFLEFGDVLLPWI